ncbi:MAG TPA: DUF2934 domain-containing protein [Tepidisphaeraceae bacterium]|nr:DUF2934 domain-containing protein [Tepidisphaeraceae bacterium]
MAKKIIPPPPVARSIPAKVAAPVASSTPVRNSPVPPRTPAIGARKSPPTRESIAQRAYFIWQSGTGGSEFENWIRAERELSAL